MHWLILIQNSKFNFILKDGNDYKFSSPITQPIRPPYEKAKYLKQNNLIGLTEKSFLDKSNSI